MRIKIQTGAHCFAEHIAGELELDKYGAEWNESGTLELDHPGPEMLTWIHRAVAALDSLWQGGDDFLEDFELEPLRPGGRPTYLAVASFTGDGEPPAGRDVWIAGDDLDDACHEYDKMVKSGASVASVCAVLYSTDYNTATLEQLEEIVGPKQEELITIWVNWDDCDYCPEPFYFTTRAALDAFTLGIECATSGDPAWICQKEKPTRAEMGLED